jgi:hypothetical protein
MQKYNGEFSSEDSIIHININNKLLICIIESVSYAHQPKQLLSFARSEVLTIVVIKEKDQTLLMIGQLLITLIYRQHVWSLFLPVDDL